MLNKAPIFINGFQRGGSNILVNLFLSHPEVCYPSGEMTKVFRGGGSVETWQRSVYKRLFYNLPISLISGRANFATSNLAPRPSLSPRAQRFVDRVLYKEKLAARHERHNRFIREGVEYDPQEIARSRLLCKNLTGLILMTENFAAIYPDATFFGLIRNGLALCEGHLRRGRPTEKFAGMYNLLANRMLEYSERMENYHIVHFEEILSNPVEQMKILYEKANLDFDRIEKARLQMKATLSKSGQHELQCGYDRQVIWYALENVRAHFNPDIDAIQIANLSDRDRETFLKIAGKTMEKLGYL